MLPSCLLSLTVFNVSELVKMSGLAKIGKFVPSSTTLFLCDMQVKFQPSIFKFDNVVSNSNKVLHAAQIMSGTLSHTLTLLNSKQDNIKETGLLDLVMNE